MFTKCIFVVLVVLSGLMQSAHGSNILVFMPLTSKSETMLFYPISKELVKRGHQVTIVSPIPGGGNMTGIHLIQTDESFLDDVGGDFLSSRMNGEFMGYEWEMMQASVGFPVLVAESVAKNKNVQKLFHHSNTKFDLIIVDGSNNDAVFPFIHKFQAPFIYVNTAGLHPWNLHSTGNLYAPSTIPSVVGGENADRMSLWQRVDNVARVFFWHWSRNNRVLPAIRQVMKDNGLLLEDTPDFLDIEKQAKLILAHRPMEAEFPTPALSNVVKIGCVHCKKAQPLPKDLKEFADGSGDAAGFIYFSLGSIAKLDNNRELVKKLLFSAFALIPQRILVKWDHDVTNEEIGAPPNVKLVSWAPQQDVLGHPKCKVFISHCGLFGTQEAMYHGVPVIGFPLFWDQHYNAIVMEKQGMAINMEVSKITPNSMLEALQKITTNPSYRSAAKRMSRFIRDQPMPSMDLALHWIEYVIRHGDTPFLPAASAEMHMFQVWMLDVWLVVLGTVIAVAFLLYKMIKKVLCTLFSAGQTEKREKNKKL